jgi:hypothetical protein
MIIRVNLGWLLECSSVAIHGIFTEHIDHAMGKPWLGMDGGHLKYAMIGRTQGAQLETNRFAEDL